MINIDFLLAGQSALTTEEIETEQKRGLVREASVAVNSLPQEICVPLDQDLEMSPEQLASQAKASIRQGECEQLWLEVELAGATALQNQIELLTTTALALKGKERAEFVAENRAWRQQMLDELAELPSKFELFKLREKALQDQRRELEALEAPIRDAANRRARYAVEFG